MDVDVEIRDLAPQRVVTIREQAAADGLGAAFRELYPVIWAYLEKQGVRPSGPSFGLFHAYSEDEVDFEAGLPVDGPVEGEGRIESKELPGGTAAVARHEGPYATIGQVHEALDRFVHQRGGGHAGPPREVYLVGPRDEDDASKWRTEVVYLIGEA